MWAKAKFTLTQGKRNQLPVLMKNDRFEIEENKKNGFLPVFLIP